MNDYLVKLIEKHLNLLKVSCERMDIKRVLLSSPSYPSVLSLVQTYLFWGLKADAFRVDRKGLAKLPQNTIGHIRKDNQEYFILILHSSTEIVEYYDAFLDERIVLPTDEFSLLWSGIVVVVRKEECVTPCRDKSRMWYNIQNYHCFILFYSILVISLTPLNGATLYYYILLCLNMFGIWICKNIIQIEEDPTLLHSSIFCHDKGIFSCREILQSKGSSLIGKIKLSNIAMFYFLTCSIFLNIQLIHKDVFIAVQGILYSSLCTLPFIAFSLIYQKVIAKKWCTLCLSIVLILSIQLLLNLALPIAATMPSRVISYCFFSIFWGITLLMLFKGYIQIKLQYLKHEISELKIKRTQIVLQSLLGEESKKISERNDIVSIGYPSARITITTFLNPLCTPCKKLSVEIIALICKYPTLIKWHILLDGCENAQYSEANKIQIHLFKLLSGQKKLSKQLDIIKMWFAQQDLEKFTQKYPLDAIREEDIQAFTEHVVENKKLQVDKLPTIWVNGHLFPKEYSIKEIPYMLFELSVLGK